MGLYLRGWNPALGFSNRHLHPKVLQPGWVAPVVGGASRRTELAVEHFFEVVDGLTDVCIHFHAVLYQSTGVEHRAVIPTAKGFTDSAEGGVGHMPGEEHGDLARKGDMFRAALAGHICQPNIEVVGDAFLYELDGDRVATFFMEDFTEQFLHDFLGKRFSCEGGKGCDADEGPLESTDVGTDTGGEEVHDLGGELDSEGVFLFAKDGEARFDIRRLQVGGQSPFEARHEPLFEILNLVGGAIAGHDDLFAGFVEGIEGMEELFMDAFFAGEELNVVDEQDIGLAVSATEFGELVILDGVDVVVGEAFGGDVGDAGSFSLADDLEADGVEQVGFTEADAAIDEEGVIGLAGGMGYGECGGVGEAVIGADDEILEGIFGIEGEVAYSGANAVGLLGGWGGAGGGAFGFGGRVFGAVFGDAEDDFQGAAGGGFEDILDEVQVVVLDPQFAEVIGDLKGEAVLVDGSGGEGGEPQAVEVGVEEPLQHLLCCMPNCLSRGGLDGG